MHLRKYIRQIRPITEKKVDYVNLVQNIVEVKGLDIGELQKIRGGKPRLHLLIDVINNKTKVNTTKGMTTLNWVSDTDKVALETGDLLSAFTDGRRYKPIFRTDKGDLIRLNDILKTDMFGGGKGSGGGSENTDLTECAQCIYAAAIFNGAKLKSGDSLSGEEYGTYNTSFDIDTPPNTVAEGLTDDWIESSILIGNELKKNLGPTKFVFHKGSTFVKEIEGKFKDLNNAEKPKPFSNINKWSPADIWAVKVGARFDFTQYSTLGEWTNELKELYDKKELIGISLKKAVGSVKTEEKNITGFIRRPVRYGGYLKQKNFFSSKDFYIYLDKIKMQLRTFDEVKSWQGEVKGTSASAGKVGGGVLESIMIKNSTVTKFKYTNNELKTLATNPTPTFLDELYQMYLGLVGKGAIDKQKFIEQASAKRIGRVSGADWRFSKFRGMFYVAQLESNKSIANKVCDNIAAYSLSASDEAAPHVVYK